MPTGTGRNSGIDSPSLFMGSLNESIKSLIGWVVHQELKGHEISEAALTDMIRRITDKFDISDSRPSRPMPRMDKPPRADASREKTPSRTAPTPTQQVVIETEPSAQITGYIRKVATMWRKRTGRQGTRS